MRIAKDDQVAGYPAIKIRNYLRPITDIYIGAMGSVENVEDELGISNSDARALVKQLLAEGYIEIAHMNGLFKLTAKGKRFSLATARKPIKKKTADNLLSDFIKRVEHANSQGTFAYTIEKVIVFGSYLDDEVNRINDLDIAVDLVHKGNSVEDRLRIDQERIISAIKNKRIFSSSLEQLTWPYIEVVRHLKNGSRSISLHTTDDRIFAMPQTRSRTIYVRT
ncbi:hypothetical protein [Cohnella soli]|uniref:Polymerase beta nucleotidyltransferase domain-containing protein n=1 Tax=Cohnella soli TaxID=425005 RepID=A0ABW0HTN3_9BACL